LHPVLFTFGVGQREIALHSYGVLIAVGLAIGIAVAHREGRRRGFDGGRVLDLAFWLTVSGLCGSRIAYGLVNARDFFHACMDGGGPWWRDCTRVLQVWEGGLVFYGGVAVAAFVAFVFARREGWSFANVGDLFAPALAIGHAFGRLGCFAAGCCFGKETASRWGVAFPRHLARFRPAPAKRRRCTRRSSTKQRANWRSSWRSGRCAPGSGAGPACFSSFTSASTPFYVSSSRSTEATSFGAF
jgi:phosphatidylglycerol:prolipoprotein diacylglycerol transferase